MADPEQIRRMTEAVTGRTICLNCADILLALLDAVRPTRDDDDADQPDVKGPS